jgi:hypothetical protein
VIPELIYCSDGNAAFAKIAIEAGFTYGTQLPKTIYFPPEFVDQDYKKPNLEKYARVSIPATPGRHLSLSGRKP